MLNFGISWYLQKKCHTMTPIWLLFFVSFGIFEEFIINFIYILQIFEDDITYTSFESEPDERIKLFCDNVTRDMLMFLCRCLSWVLTLSPPFDPSKGPQMKYNAYDKVFVELFSTRLAKSFNKHKPDFDCLYRCKQ